MLMGMLLINAKRREMTEQKERKRRKSLGIVGREASLDDWLAGQCGVLDFAWWNQGFLRQNKPRALASYFNVTRKMSLSS